MATTEKTYTLSNTSTGPYTFTFPYIKEADVKVSKNGTELDLTTEYTQATTSITLVDTPEIGDKIRIYRVTDDSGLTATFYPGSAIRSTDLNDNFTQNLYSTQEVVSRYYDIGGTLPLEGDMDAADNKITNVGTPTAQTDAANKEYVDDQDNLLAGTDLTKTKDDTANTITIDHDAVGASSVNNSDGTVIQDLTISTTGHVTGHGSVNLDSRYYTETELDAGQLDNRYYTETELNAGQLDNRYYTETEADTKFFSSDYSTEVNTVYNNIGAVEAVGTDLANSFSNISDYGAVTAAVTSSSGTSDIQTVSDDITNVNTVSGSIANVNTVATDLDLGATSNITVVYTDIKSGGNNYTNTVAGSIANVNLVGPSITNVNTIATTSGLIADIATVAGDATDIGAVAGKETEIGRLGTADAVADLALLATTDAIADMALLGTSDCVADMAILGTADAVSDMETIVDTPNLITGTKNLDIVAGIASNVTTVAGISANTTTVAGISANVTTVADISSDVPTVAGVSSEVGNLGTTTAVSNLGTVSGISSNVTTVADISDNVTTVADISGNVTTVAAIDTNVTTVAGISSDVTDVAGVKEEVVSVSIDINDQNNTATVGRDIGSKIGLINFIDVETPVDHGDLTTHGSTADYSNVTSTFTTKINYNDYSRIEVVFDNITDINTVAGKATEIGRLGTDDVIADMALLGTSDCVADMALLGTADVVSDLNTLATADIVADMALLATADIVADMALLGTSDCATGMALLGTTDAIADMALLTATGVIDDLETCANSITAIDGASANATAAAAAQTAAETSETNAETAETNAETARDLAEDYKDLAQQTYSDTQGIYTQQRSVSYNINSASDFGDLTSTVGIFTSETTDTLLTMSTGSSTYDYLGV